MDKKETSRILQLMFVTYPQFFKSNDPVTLNALTDVWQSCFIDNSYQDVAQALKYHISTDTLGYPPVPGKLKENVIKIHSPTELDAVSAWGYVKRALSNSLYNSSTEFDKLPTTVKTIVGNPATLRSWAQCETSQIDTVIASNFQKNYREMILKEKEQAMLPNSLKNLIESNGMTYIGENQLKLPKNQKVEFDREAVLRRIEASKNK